MTNLNPQGVHGCIGGGSVDFCCYGCSDAGPYFNAARVFRLRHFAASGNDQYGGGEGDKRLSHLIRDSSTGWGGLVSDGEPVAFAGLR